MQLEPNQIIDNRYKVIAKLGEGGMGAVWKAMDSKHGDEVVIKIPLNHLDADISRRFAREAKAMRKYSLECPNILNIEDIGMVGDVPWYVMRYLPGGSVRDRLLPRDTSGAVKWTADSFDWLDKIAAALDFLHDNQSYHRDVKPENVLFSSVGTPYLVDFGIVKTVSETTSMVTEQGKAVGTMAYMAPETLDGEPFTSKADQYSLAVTLYESITGDRPFSGTTFFALFKSIQMGHRKLAELSPAVPTLASQAVDRALSTDPEKRFDSCKQFCQAFLAGLDSSEVAHVETTEVIADEALTGLLKPAVHQKRREPLKPILEPQVANNKAEVGSLFGNGDGGSARDQTVTCEPQATYSQMGRIPVLYGLGILGCMSIIAFIVVQVIFVIAIAVLGDAHPIYATSIYLLSGSLAALGIGWILWEARSGKCPVCNAYHEMLSSADPEDLGITDDALTNLHRGRQFQATQNNKKSLYQVYKCDECMSWIFFEWASNRGYVGDDVNLPNVDCWLVKLMPNATYQFPESCLCCDQPATELIPLSDYTKGWGSAAGTAVSAAGIAASLAGGRLAGGIVREIGNEIASATTVEGRTISLPDVPVCNDHARQVGLKMIKKTVYLVVPNAAAAKRFRELNSQALPNL